MKGSYIVQTLIILHSKIGWRTLTSHVAEKEVLSWDPPQPDTRERGSPQHIAIAAAIRTHHMHRLAGHYVPHWCVASSCCALRIAWHNSSTGMVALPCVFSGADWEILCDWSSWGRGGTRRDAPRCGYGRDGSGGSVSQTTCHTARSGTGVCPAGYHAGLPGSHQQNLWGTWSIFFKRCLTHLQIVLNILISKCEVVCPLLFSNEQGSRQFNIYPIQNRCSWITLNLDIGAFIVSLKKWTLGARSYWK